MRVAVLAALCAALAYGQSATQVFSLSRSYMAQQVQEIANAIRVITVVPTNQAQLQLRIDSQAKTLTATGTADQLALAAWMLDALQSATGSELSHQYPDRTRIGGEVRVVHLRQFQTPQEIQEMVNTLRTIIDISHLYQITEPHVVFIRATASQIAAAEWLIDKLDRPVGQQTAAASYTMQPTDTVDGEATTIRVVYLPQVLAGESLISTLNAIRSSTGIARIYGCCFSAHAVALRGTDAQVLQAEALLAKH